MTAEPLQRRIAAAHQATGFDDWWFALFTAACAETGDAEKALEIADRVYKEHKTQASTEESNDHGG